MNLMNLSQYKVFYCVMRTTLYVFVNCNSSILNTQFGISALSCCFHYYTTKIAEEDLSICLLHQLPLSLSDSLTKVIETDNQRERTDTLIRSQIWSRTGPAVFNILMRKDYIYLSAKHLNNSSQRNYFADPDAFCLVISWLALKLHWTAPLLFSPEYVCLVKNIWYLFKVRCNKTTLRAVLLHWGGVKLFKLDVGKLQSLLCDLCVHVCVRHAKLKTKETHRVYIQHLNVLGLACLNCVHVAFMLICAPLTHHLRHLNSYRCCTVTYYFLRYVVPFLDWWYS